MSNRPAITAELMASKLELSDPALGGGAATPSPSSAPGKRAATSRLAPRSQIVFRVESAEAAAVFADRFGPRDANGVAAGANTAVDRASSSSGAPLPDAARARVETSLGADLSSVRVHTGAPSAEAASAVGARAYTTGNDIHFGAGQYAPDDPFGLHLLAHEVAHTQQQAAAPATTQYKLEVSSPGDSAEVEADRAADAMVTGVPATVASSQDPFGMHLLGHPVQRKPKNSTEQLHEDVYGDSSLAHGSPASDNKYLISALHGNAFPWSGPTVPKVPKVELIDRWLDYYSLVAASPIDKDEPDACQFNLSSTWNVDNVTNVFMVDSKMAGYAYDAGVVRDTVVNVLRPKEHAKWHNDYGGVMGPGAGGGGAGDNKKEADTSTKVELSWTYTPHTIKKGFHDESSSDQHTSEVAGRFTLQLHKDGHAGLDLSADLQATFAPLKGGGGMVLQKVGPAIECQWVAPIINEFLELQIVGQLLAASKYEVGQQFRGQVTGARLAAPMPEVSLSPQLVFSVPGTDKRLKIIGGAKGTPEGGETGLSFQLVKEF